MLEARGGIEPPINVANPLWVDSPTNSRNMASFSSVLLIVHRSVLFLFRFGCGEWSILTRGSSTSSDAEVCAKQARLAHCGRRNLPANNGETIVFFMTITIYEDTSGEHSVSPMCDLCSAHGIIRPLHGTKRPRIRRSSKLRPACPRR